MHMCRGYCLFFMCTDTLLHATISIKKKVRETNETVQNKTWDKENGKTNKNKTTCRLKESEKIRCKLEEKICSLR